jgi:hypothetical protein
MAVAAVVVELLQTEQVDPVAVARLEQQVEVMELRILVVAAVVVVPVDQPVDPVARVM